MVAHTRSDFGGYDEFNPQWPAGQIDQLIGGLDGVRADAQGAGEHIGRPARDDADGRAAPRDGAVGSAY